jgi:fibronectin type 3 domain-containing protein
VRNILSLTLIWLLLGVAGFQFPDSLNAQTTSALWGVDGANWDPETSLLRDFSDVGYRGGDVSIPDWPVGVNVSDFGAIPNDGLDDSQAIMDAIAACPDFHAVLIPNGRYTILQRMVPQRDNFVLRGEDMYETVLFFPKYLNEIEIQEIGIDPEDPNNRHIGAPKGFFRIEGGTHRSIENLTFEFREQIKLGHWEHKGATALWYGDGVVDSWVRNLYIKNVDHGLMMDNAERISFLNMIFDHSISRPDIYGTGNKTRFTGHIGLHMQRAKRCLFHNIEFKGDLSHDFDISGVPSYSVVSNVVGVNVNLHHHAQGAHHNLYTNVYVGNSETGISGLKDSQRQHHETHWRIYGDQPLLTSDVQLDTQENHVFVGYGSDIEQTVTDTLYYEAIDPLDLYPQNIYLAQLEKRGKPLPAPPPPQPPSPFSGDVIRINPVEDTTVDGANPESPSDPEGKWLSLVRNPYLKFDLSELSLATIAKARLRLYSDKFYNTPVEFGVYSVADDSWSDATLTFNNRPPAVDLLASLQVDENSTARVVEFDITPYIQAEWAGDKVVSINLDRIAGSGFLSGFHSLDDGRAPELIIEQVPSAVAGPPSAPTGLKSHSIIGNVRLDWDDNPEADVATYNVYRSTVSADFAQYDLPVGMGLVTSDFVDIQHIHESGWDVGMLRSDTIYFYRVTAVDAHEYESPASTEFVATTLDPLNSPPAFLPNPALANALARTSYSGDLKDVASDPESDTLYFFKIDGPDWLTIDYDGTLSGTPQLSDGGSNQFTVQVNALGGRGEALLTIEVDIPADSPPGAPAVPVGLTPSVDDSVVDLSWVGNSEADLYGYYVYRSQTAGVFLDPPIALVLEGNAYIDTGVTNGQTYHYAITALDFTDNQSALSPPISVVPADTVPDAPTGLQAVAGEAMVSLDWGDGSELDLAGYNIYRTISEGVYDENSLLDSVSESEYIDSSAENGVTYYYVVKAMDQGANESEASTEQVATPVDLVPSPPINLTATARDGAVFLDWNDNSEADFAGYHIYRRISPGSYALPMVEAHPSSYFLDTSASNGTTYHYVVSAVDAGTLQSPFSLEAMATPLSGILSETNFIGQTESGAADNLITTAGNWDNGLPVAQPGTISVDAAFDSRIDHLDYQVSHLAGSLDMQGGLDAFKLGPGTVWTMDGAEARIGRARGIQVDRATFTLLDGHADLTENNRDTIVSGASGAITVHGGILEVGRALRVQNGGQLTVNGGTLGVGGKFSTSTLFSAPGPIQFNGGTIYAESFQFDTPATITFGGTKDGSLTLSNSLGIGATLDWLTGTRMTMTVAPADEWAETEWNAGRLTYNGLGIGDLGSWAAVTMAGGLGDAFYFAYDSTSETLSLATDYPAPLAPGNLNAVPGAGQIHLTWQDNSADETSFLIQRADSAGGPFATVATMSADINGYTDPGLGTATTYHYRVLASNLYGDSDPSNEASAQTFNPAEMWRYQHFGQSTNDGIAADAHDYDGDGQANLIERAFGSSPVDGSDFREPEYAIVESGGNEYISMTYRRLIGGTGPDEETGVNYALNDLSYIIEHDRDLEDPWANGYVVDFGEIVDQGDGTETVTVRVLHSLAEEPRYFMRLRLITEP